MTTVVALARDGGVWMAADSLTNVYERPIVGAARKIRRHAIKNGGEILLGFSGDGALPALVHRHLVIDAEPQDADDVQGVQDWADTIAVAITELGRGAGLVEQDRLDATALLGWRGQLWTLTHAQAITMPDGIGALGSGEGPAIGALDALLLCGEEPAAAIAQAVRIGTARDRSSRGPFDVETLLPTPVET